MNVKSKISDLFKEGSILSILRSVARTSVGALSLVIIIAVLIAGIFPSYVSPYDPLELNLKERLQTPNSTYLLGTDDVGRDILSRVIHGASISVKVGLIVTLTGGLLGIVLGSLAGYYGGKVDVVIMRFADMILALPGLILAIGVLGIVGANILNLMFILSVYFWPRYARVVRGLVLKSKELEYIQAAQVIGVKSRNIIFREIVPNVLPEVIILGTLTMGTAILWEAGLSFLGLGVPPPQPSWGNMLALGRIHLLNSPHVAVFPGLAITITILAFNLLGDSLRDVLDPKLRR